MSEPAISPQSAPVHRDYLEKRKIQGRRTAYDYAIDRDQKALSWAIRAIVRYVPDEEKSRPEPPRPARKPSRRLSANQRRLYEGQPSWNGKTKRDWAGLDLPELRWEMPAGFRDPEEGQDSAPDEAQGSQESADTGSTEQETRDESE